MKPHFWKDKKQEVIQLVGFATSTLLAIVAYKFTSHYGFKDFLFSNVDPIAQGLIVWVGTFTFSVWVSILFYRDRIEQKIEDLPRALEAILPIDVGVRDEGTIDAVFPELHHKLSSARSVKNTCIVFLTEQADKFANYNFRFGKDIVDSVCACINGDAGSTWQDILSEGVAVERVQNIRRGIQRKTAYSVHIVKSPAAVINFVIIEPKHAGLPKEVYFGFGLHDYDKDAHIFSTSNPSIVTTFERMFLLLENRFSVPAHDLY